MIYKAISRKNAETFCKQHHAKKSILISIKSSWDKESPKVFCSKENNIQDILSLCFDDIELEDSLRKHNKEFCMTKNDALAIKYFVEHWFDKVDMIVIHCDGGVSRSAGIAAGLMQVYEGKGGLMWKKSKKYPNMTCFLRTLQAFNYIK